jgi:dihydroorotate dehydrogenase electron transfer subunit
MPVNRIAPLVAGEALGERHWLLTFRHPETARQARAGQFVMIKAGTSAELPLRRPFSIMAIDPDRETFTLLVKEVGPGSRALCALPPGGVAQCLGPLGRPFTPPPPGTEALLVAGGYGIAPFWLFAQEITRMGGRVHVFYGGRTAADLPLLARFADAAAPVTGATEDGSVGHRGQVTAPLVEWLKEAKVTARLYACGPDAMLQAVTRLAAERGLAAEVSLDPWMGCGIGTCLGCVVRIQVADDPHARYRCACTEGPVFDAAHVVWPGEETSSAHRVAEGHGVARAER